MSPIVDSEFGWSLNNWQTEGTVKISFAQFKSLSGRYALKVEAQKSQLAAVYQQTPAELYGQAPKAKLISVRRGKLYRISFIAMAETETGSVKVRLADVSGPKSGFWTSDALTIKQEKDEYTIEYRHTGNDVKDVRLSFLFGDKDQVIYLDKIALRGSK